MRRVNQARSSSLGCHELVAIACAISVSTKELVLFERLNWSPQRMYRRKDTHDVSPVLLRCRNKTSTRARIVSTGTGIPAGMIAKY